MRIAFSPWLIVTTLAVTLGGCAAGDTTTPGDQDTSGTNGQTTVTSSVTASSGAQSSTVAATTGVTTTSGGLASSTAAGPTSSGTGGAPATSSSVAGPTTTAGAGAGGAGASGGAGSGGAGASGIGGAGATGGAGGTLAYAPCPANGSPCKILPLGDSITLGAKSSDGGGYRSQLFKLIVAANQKITFTGSLASGPAQVSGQPFPRMHEGHSGWTISQLPPLIPSPALDVKPNIVLLHIGTNDIGYRDPTLMATRLEALIDKIAQNGPDALIVVAQITTARTDNDIRDAYNAKIPGIVQSHGAKGQHIISVDMNKIPMADLSSDGVHPNDQGYTYMAGVWYTAIKDLLPQ